MALFLICTIILASKYGAAQASIAELGTQRMEVVRLRSQPQDRGTQTFAGLYVGRDQQNAYFITVFHALCNRSCHIDPPSTVGAEVQSTTKSPSGVTPSRALAIRKSHIAEGCRVYEDEPLLSSRVR